MTICIRVRVPNVELFVMGADGPTAISSDDLFGAKLVALFGLPGAFTKTCSAKHLPGFVNNAEALKAKGVGEIICLSVNDAWVMNAWGEGHVAIVGDGGLNFTRWAGLEVDLSAKGYGQRCKRFSALLDDGVVTHLHFKDGGFGENSAETLLGDL